MWKFVSFCSLVLLLTSCNGLPVESESDNVSNSDNQEIPTLATDLLPPLENAEVADFRNFRTEKKRTISSEFELPRRIVTAPFRDEDEALSILKKKKYSSKASGSDDVKVPLSLELEPPKETTDVPFYIEDKENATLGVVFIVNLYAVKNSSGENSKEILSDEVTSMDPSMLEPVATILLILEEDDEKRASDLDGLAKDLEDGGMKIEKIAENGETKMIKINFDETLEDNDVELVKPGKFNKVRRRRTICSSCGGGGLLSKLLNKHKGNGCQGNCGGGGGGGYPPTQTVGVIPVVVVEQPQYRPQPQYQPQPHYQPQPVYRPAPQPHYQSQPHYQPQPQYQPQPHYQPQPQPHYQPQQSCNTCGGGNHGSYSQSSAQASAQSSSGSW